MRIEPISEDRMSWMMKPMVWLMKRRFGKVLNPFKAWAYRPGLTLTMSIFTQSVESSKLTDPVLKRLVCLRAAQMIGCVF
ncbi:MAG TPA: hypothetical protein VEU51_11500 [Candidatus Acidoferrales bacterium]|nr:hypothetical protein [Candidatus Acidoferrales bacterium]